jgi:hypothetical protein
VDVPAAAFQATGACTVKLIATTEPSLLCPVPLKVSSSSPGDVESLGRGTGTGLADAGGVARPVA